MQTNLKNYISEWEDWIASEKRLSINTINSYKIDLRGDDRIWGLEEFSVQKPITRNYIYEYIFHKLLETNKLIALKYFFINLSLNDTNQGIYAVEEGFSKELIERSKKRNGPIFGVEELISFEYPKKLIN